VHDWHWEERAKGKIPCENCNDVSYIFPSTDTIISRVTWSAGKKRLADVITKFNRRSAVTSNFRTGQMNYTFLKHKLGALHNSSIRRTTV